MKTIRMLLGALLVLSLTVVGGVMAVSASAHTPTIAADCDQLSVALASYDTGGVNHIKVTIDSAVKADTNFGAAYSHTFPIADKTKAYAYTVVVTAWDDPTGSKGFSKTFTGSSTPCQPPPPPCVSTVNTNDISAHYVTDDFHAVVEYTGQTLCAGVSKTVSLNSYRTDGPTWPTSGTQVFVDHDQVTLDANTTSGTLVVDQPSCYYQTDLYFGSTLYNGVDGALPHYPNSVTPTNLIASRNGGAGCQVVQPSGQFTTVCTATGAQADIGTLNEGSLTGGTFELVWTGGSVTVTSGQQNVTVPEFSHITLQYVRAGQPPVSLEQQDSPHACTPPPPPPVQPSGHFTTECTATAARADIGPLSVGDFPGGTFSLVSGAFTATVTSGQQDVAVPASATITLQYQPAQGAAKVLDTEQSPAACPPPPPPVGEVVKTSSPVTGTVVPAGSTIAYTVTVKNAGQVPILNAPVVDTLPIAVTAVAGTVSDGGVVSADGRTITWTVSLPVGVTKALTYSGLVANGTTAGTELVNKATFLLKESTTTHVVGTGALTLHKVVSPVAADGVVVEFGDTLTYTLTASATGTLGQQNVVVTDYVPGHDPARPGSGSTTYVAGSAACVGSGSCTVAGPNADGLIIWSLGDMAAGTTRQVTFQVVIDDVPAAADGSASADILNAGAVKSDQTPVLPSNEVRTPVSKVLGVKVGNEEQPPAAPAEEQPSATQATALPHTGVDLPLGGLVGGGLGLLLAGVLLVAAASGRPRRLSS